MSSDRIYYYLCGLLTCACLSVKSATDLPEAVTPSCDSQIYCQGDLLRTIQIARIFDDSKTFVDMSMKRPPEEILKIFADLMKSTVYNPSKAQIENFINENFVSGTELEKWIPEDFNAKPAFISRITNTKLANFAERIVATWKDLGRKVKKEVYHHPELHSLIPIPNGFIIPGGRFNEYYYWDNYWILEGLILCGMTDTVRGIIDNFITMVRRYGFVPNGGRIYYTNRSQPPMLTFMAKNYYEASRNLTWLRRNINYLSHEVKFWVRERMRRIRIGNTDYDIAFYICNSDGPRPESYREDIATASVISDQKKKQKLYKELKAAAQSGWDFSSRWIFDDVGGTNANLSYTQTTRAAAVDLNAYLYGAFRNLGRFYSLLGHRRQARYWKAKARKYLQLFQNVFWNDEDGTWYDFDIELMKQRKFFAASNLAPLWVKAYHRKDIQISKVIQYLISEGIASYPGGIPATKKYTDEQWDFPNCFPPLQSIIVQGLEKSGDLKARELAKTFAKKWVEANLIGEEIHGAMFEKYHAQYPGQCGQGGEYEVQKGFGWTNGVLLDFINRYYTEK